MKPAKITFYVYSDSDDETLELQRELHDFVDGYYRRGTLVRACRLTRALRAFGNNAIVTNYLKKSL